MSGRGSGVLGSGSGPCGACKFLRRKCVTGCIFAPYFGSEQGAANFSAVHKVFGASNVSKLLMHIPTHKRLDAVVTICYEAQARLRDPIYGCVAHIIALQQQVLSLQGELSFLRAHLATFEMAAAPPPPPPPLPPLSSAIAMPVTESAPGPALGSPFDLATLFETQVARPASRRQFAADEPPFRGDDLRSLARELVASHRTVPTFSPPATK
ncbi:LOB domain-containing protein 30-like [Wolffia australiana]